MFARRSRIVRRLSGFGELLGQRVCASRRRGLFACAEDVLLRKLHLLLHGLVALGQIYQ